MDGVSEAFRVLSFFGLILFLIAISGVVFADSISRNGGDFSTDNSIGTINWVNPSGAQYLDNSFATINIIGNSEVTQYLKVTNFGFNIPANAIISGIVVSVDRNESGSTGRVFDNSIKLVNNGVIVGTNKSIGSEWLSESTYVKGAYSFYGGINQDWGQDWNFANINNPNFGVVISARHDGTDDFRNISVNHVMITVYYFIDTTAPQITAPSGIVAEATSLGGAIILFDANATDTESGVKSSSCFPTSGSLFSLGDTIVSCTATDNAGNIGLPYLFNVIIQDTTKPVLILPPDFIVSKDSLNSAVVSFFVSAADSVDPAVIPVCVPVSGSMFSIGTTVVSCDVNDFSGNEATGSFSVAVTNAVPVLDLIGARTVDENNLLTFAISGSDADVVDGNVLVFSVSGLPSGADFNSETNTFSWTPGFNQSGIYYIDFNATDGIDSAGERVMTIVNNVNRAPVVNMIPASSVVVGGVVSFVVSATDSDGDLVIFSTDLNALFSGADFNSETNIFNWNTIGVPIGSYTIVFTVTDGNLSTDANAVIIITTVPAPVLLNSNGGSYSGGSSGGINLIKPNTTGIDTNVPIIAPHTNETVGVGAGNIPVSGVKEIIPLSGGTETIPLSRGIENLIISTLNGGLGGTTNTTKGVTNPFAGVASANGLFAFGSPESSAISGIIIAVALFGAGFFFWKRR
ncbi:MAG: HYR domain-containing protein [Candidatus Diapherotrites archaeon]|nr:HYR domain-containing protein [Candidatus Diapherotrites archaeon]